MPMTWLEKDHLRRLCEKYGIDFDSEVDLTLTYRENKAHILNFARQLGREVDEDDILEETVDAWADRNIDRLVEDVKQIIEVERRILKQIKYDVGRRILQDEEWLTQRYGDNYFGRLARAIDERGYSADQLRKCVRFAQIREEVARRYIEDHSIGWEYIRRYVLREIQFLPPFQVEWQGCPAVIHHLRQISQIHSSKERSLCRPCKFYKLCRKINREAESLRQLPVRQSQT